MGRLDGRVAIVTGAGGGIGREHALLLAREGASVVVNDIGFRTGADAAAVVDEIEAAGGTAVANTASATWDHADTIVEHAVDAFGRVDILVNNATIMRVDDLWRMSEQDWDLTLEVNLKGYFAMIREVTPHMARQGGGAIVSTSSWSGFGHPSNSPYAAAKEGVVGLTRTAARELGRFGIRANAIRPMAITLQVGEYHDETGPLATAHGPHHGGEHQRHRPGRRPRRPWSPRSWCGCAPTRRRASTAARSSSRATTVMLLTEPKAQATITHEGGWDLDALDAVAPTELVAGLTNRFLLADHPDMQVFDEDGTA